MGINVSRATSQANTLLGYSDDLRAIKRSLTNSKENVNNGWQADEIAHINKAFDHINRELSNISSKLDGVSSDIIAVAHEIKREEEAEARAAAEKAAKEKEASQRK